jgi:predicted phage terminase large subunit-like protein
VKAEIEAGKVTAEIVILADSAVDGKTTSDNVAIIVLAKLSDGRKVIPAVIRAKMEPSRFVEQICEWWDVWRLVFVVRQKTALETSLQSFFRETNRRREEKGREPVRFYDYSLGKREKKARITASLQPRLQNGELYFDPDLACWPEIRQEFLQHPHSSNDDIMDALAMIDDPVISRLPVCQQAAPPRPDTYIPVEKELLDAEMLHRQKAARAAFENVRGVRRRRAHNGSVVD